MGVGTAVAVGAGMAVDIEVAVGTGIAVGAGMAVDMEVAVGTGIAVGAEVAGGVAEGTSFGGSATSVTELHATSTNKSDVTRMVRVIMELAFRHRDWNCAIAVATSCGCGVQYGPPVWDKLKYIIVLGRCEWELLLTPR